MSSTGKPDDVGSPGSDGHWKNGYNLDCGVPGTLLVDRESTGPWVIVENTRAAKNRFYVARSSHKVGDTQLSLGGVMSGKEVVAWIGSDRVLAKQLKERLNGYEAARDFPPKPNGEVGCAGEGGCCAHRRA